jgi:GNAT superfamily N-acetyltransferase
MIQPCRLDCSSIGKSAKNQVKQMQTILSDFSVPALKSAIQANWVDSYTQFGGCSHVELSGSPYLTWLLTGIPDAFLNVVFCTQLPSRHAEERVDEALAYFRSRQVRKLSWWAKSGLAGVELDKCLVRCGLIFKEGGTGMAADLGELPDTLAPIPGLTISPVEDLPALRQWVHVNRIGFGIPAYAEKRLFDLFAGVAFSPPVQCYLAVWNGQPVGTSELFLSAGVAGIYNVTCLPESRGHGIGAAVTLAALLEARRRGYRISILQASRMGYPVYRRLGFQDYGQLNTYQWENATQPPAGEDRRA